MVVLATVAGCAEFSRKPSVSYALELSDPDRVSFTGRGAGAGMMLSGSMGAMGIALGVAIDVGIGKEIEETAVQSGIEFPALLKQQLSGTASVPVYWLDDTKRADRVYRIKNYGFTSVRGSSEEVYPSFALEILEAGGVVRTMTRPDDFLVEEQAIPRARFDDIKTKSTEIERLWKAGISIALALHEEDQVLR